MTTETGSGADAVGGVGGPYVGEAVIAGAVAAPPAAAFDAWTDPELLARWWGPHGFTIAECAAEARPGGRYRIVMRAADGTDYPVTGTYREVAHPERLVFTVDLSGHPPAWHDAVAAAMRAAGAAPTPVPELLTEVLFEETRSGGTGLAIRTWFDSVARRDAFLALGMNEGWSQSLDRLAALLEEREPRGGAAGEDS